MRRQRPADWVPGPSQDFKYFDRSGGAKEPPRGSLVRARGPRTVVPVRAPKQGPVLWGDAPWPKRRPSRADARVGDVLVGNVVLRGNCACGHSAIVDAEELRARFDPAMPVRDLGDRFRCQQCGRYAAASVGYP
jgi:hypothetical protein